MRKEQMFARIAGACYVVVIVLGITCMNHAGKFLSPADATATVTALRTHEFSIRLAFLGEIGMYALVVLLALSLYAILNRVDRNMALLALLFRSGEAIIGSALAVLGTYYPLLLVRRMAESPGLSEAVQMLLRIKGAGIDAVLIFMGFGAILFFGLFWKSRLIPRFLAGWGIVVYAAMVLLSISNILPPDVPVPVQMSVYGVGAVFEASFGLWLLIRGLKTEGSDVQATA